MQAFLGAHQLTIHGAGQWWASQCCCSCKCQRLSRVLGDGTRRIYRAFCAEDMYRQHQWTADTNISRGQQRSAVAAAAHGYHAEECNPQTLLIYKHSLANQMRVCLVGCQACQVLKGLFCPDGHHRTVRLSLDDGCRTCACERILFNQKQCGFQLLRLSSHKDSTNHPTQQPAGSMDWFASVRKQARQAVNTVVNSDAAELARQLAAQATEQATALAKEATVKAQVRYIRSSCQACCVCRHLVHHVWTGSK